MITSAKHNGNAHDVPVEVLDALRSGEEWAFDSVYAEFASPLKDFITRLIHNEDDAREMIHDIFASLWTGRDTIEPDKGLRRLLFTKARSLAMDYFDHEKVKRKYVDYCNRNADHDLPVDMLFICKETGGTIDVYLEGLPTQRRTIFLLKNESKLSVSEIAEQLGLSQSTIRNNLSMVNTAIRGIVRV
jgi:RNA polymerase sigma-70 factor (ECF subfamily)